MKNMMLGDLKIGQGAVVKSYSQNIELNLKRRLLELGFCEGVKVKILNKSFLGEVVLIELNGYVLSVRKSLVKNIEVCEENL